MQWKPTKRYMSAVAALYGNDPCLPTGSGAKGRKKRNRDEELDQIKLVTWSELHGLKVFHPKNGGSLNQIEGAKFKRMGVRRGVSDLFWLYRSDQYSGLIIELKRSSASMDDVSQEQREWLNFFNDQGFYGTVAFGFDDARDIVMQYFKDASQLPVPTRFVIEYAENF